MGDPNRPGREARSLPFEGHLQTGIQVILIGLAAFIGIKVYETSLQQGIMTERVTFLTSEMRELKGQLRLLGSEQYTAHDASRAFAPILETLQDHEARIRNLEQRNRMGGG